MHVVYVAIMLLCAMLHGIPWLMDGWPAMVMSWFGVASGLFLAMSLKPYNSLWCMWIWSSLAIGIAFHWSPDAMTYTLSSEYWLGFLVALPLILWDGLRLALGYWLGARVCNRPQWIWLSTALCTILLEEFMPGVFPWRLGMMQLSWSWWLQAVDIFGAGWSTLVSFAVVGFFYNLFHYLVTARESSKSSGTTRDTRAYAWAGTVAAILLALNAGYCAWAWQSWGARIRDAQRVRMGLVQVDPSLKGSTQQMRELTREVASDVQMVCWPESSAGTYDLALEELSNDERNYMLSREPERGLRPWPNPTCELLLAGKNYSTSLLNPVHAKLTESDEGDEQPELLYVSAMLLDATERIVARYHKRYLMPFGEYVPGEKIVPGMATLFDMCEHVTPGSGNAVLKSSTGARIGVMLCYEDMVQRAASTASLQGANVIVSLINGSAFASPITLHQHRLLAHMRSLETRRTFVRCAATGQTCVISARGEVESTLPLQENGVLKADVVLLDGVTLFAKMPFLLNALIVPALFWLGWQTNRRTQSSAVR